MNQPPQVAARRDGNVDCVDTESGWDALQADWRRLEGIDPVLSCFRAASTPIRPLSPSDVIMACAVEQAVTEGRTAFDMLKGRDHDYERQLFERRRHQRCAARTPAGCTKRWR